MLFIVPIASPVAGIAVLRAALDLRIRGQGVVRIAVAAEAVPHAHRHVLVHHVHRLHLAVAGLAGDAAVHVRPVIEIDMIRQHVNTPPLQRPAGVVDRGQLLDGGAVGFRHPMAVHAGFNRRHAREARARRSRVAVLARDLHSSGMQLVRVRDRLHWSIAAGKTVRLRPPAYGRDAEEHRRRPDRQDGTRHSIVLAQNPTPTRPLRTGLGGEVLVSMIVRSMEPILSLTGGDAR